VGISKKNIQFTVKLPAGYSTEEKVAISQEIIDYVRKRTQSGKAADGSSFPKYTKAYEGSLDFRNVKSKGAPVNLTLSGDMLAALGLVDVSKNKLTLGYDPSDPEAPRVEGNVIGSYGGSPKKSRARDFLGLNEKELARILQKYPLDNEEKRALRAKKILDTEEEAQAIADKLGLDLGDGG